MLRNFITIAVRNFNKHQFYTLINILGQTIGITVCLIILLLLPREFGKLILWGFILATPLAAYCIQWYRQDYAYKTEIGWWIYISAGMVTFVLAMITMGYQSILAAKANPVEALKGE